MLTTDHGRTSYPTINVPGSLCCFPLLLIEDGAIMSDAIGGCQSLTERIEHGNNLFLKTTRRQNFMERNYPVLLFIFYLFAFCEHVVVSDILQILMGGS